MIIYWHKSIVNQEEKFRVWLNGNMIGEFNTEHEAKELHDFTILSQSNAFKQAIIDSYNQGRISMLHESFVDAEQYYQKTFAIKE